MDLTTKNPIIAMLIAMAVVLFMTAAIFLAIIYIPSPPKKIKHAGQITPPGQIIPPGQITPPGPQYGAWSTTNWGPCSAACGGGTQSRTVSCSTNICNPALTPASTNVCNTQNCIEYMGCYNDNTTRILPKFAGNKTKESCYNAVKQITPTPQYFGLQFRNSSNSGIAECWYGNGPYDTLGAANNCSTSSDANYPGYITGGAYSNAVYKINA